MESNQELATAMMHGCDIFAPPSTSNVAATPSLEDLPALRKGLWESESRGAE